MENNKKPAIFVLVLCSIGLIVLSYFIYICYLNLMSPDPQIILSVVIAMSAAADIYLAIYWFLVMYEMLLES